MLYKARMRTLACLALVLSLVSSAAARPGPPDWAADAVWYQIFPERFRNGDPRNDPTPADIAGSWPQAPVGAGWRTHPWTSDWYARQPWEPKDKDFAFVTNQRRYGGDLQGVIDKLDYLKSLGITAIYFNPIFEAPSSHKYDASYYHHVDNNFGPDPAGDRAIWESENPADPSTWKWTSADRLFLQLLAEAHRRGIRVVIDGVFNHTGQNFWAFQDLKKNGAASPYRDWYNVKQFDDPTTPANEFAYSGWFGVPELPELKDEGDTLAAGPREHLHAIVRRWGDPNGDGDPSDGIDGWRLDAAELVGHGFWRDFRTWVLEVNPNAYITAELWWEDYAANKIFNGAPWLGGDQFDAVMNYRWAAATRLFFLDQKTAITPTEFDRRLAALRADYRDVTNYALQNLMDSHDTDRVSSMAVNPDHLYDHKISWRDDPTYQVRAPRADERARQRLVTIFQFAYLGAPMIYYGDEAGMWGGDDPDERKPMVWQDMRYDNEKIDPLGRPRPNDPVRFDTALYRLYAQLSRIRTESEPLRRGTIRTVIADDSARVFGFVRESKGHSVTAIFNASTRSQTVAAPAGRDLLTNRKIVPVRSRIVVPPMSAVLIAN